MQKDTIWKDYLSDNTRYADLINGLGCSGRQVVTEKDLHEKDTQTGIHQSMAFPTSAQSKKKKRRPTKTRDTIRRAAFGMNFAVIGIENQEELDYEIPLRNMNYDISEYNSQAAKIRREIRKENWKDTGLTAGEYFYGFRKDSRLHLVLTFILYMGQKPWDGPRSLHDIIDFTDIPFELYRLIPNYEIHLIEVRKFEHTDVFRTDVKQVFDFIRNAENKEALKRTIEQDAAYQEMEEDAYDVITCYANVKDLVQKKDYHKIEGGKVNMCTAIRELMEDSKLEGRIEGKEEGKEEGREEGRAEEIIEGGYDFGLSEHDILARLQKKLQITMEKAQQYMDMFGKNSQSDTKFQQAEKNVRSPDCRHIEKGKIPEK